MIWSIFIKTVKVLVDTSNLINSFEQLIESKYDICCTDSMISRNLMPKKFEDQILKQLIGKNSKKCVFTLTTLKKPIDLARKAFILNANYVDAFLSIYVQKKKDAVFWVYDKSIFENIIVHYFRTDLNPFEKESINRFELNLLETGIYRILFKVKFKKQKVFSDLDEYIKNNSIFLNLDLETFIYLFKIVICIQSLICLIFILQFISTVLFNYLQKCKKYFIFLIFQSILMIKNLKMPFLFIYFQKVLGTIYDCLKKV